MSTPKKQVEEQLYNNWAKALQVVQHHALPNYSSYEIADVDVFVCLAGRTTFAGDFVPADILKFAAIQREIVEQNIDVVDTRRRMLGTIKLARKSYERFNKIPIIFFSGTKEHIDTLMPWLRENGYFGLPKECYIVQKNWLNDTLGQILSLNSYMNTLACEIPIRALKVLVCTSTYHVPRASLVIGNSSPALTAAFWVVKRDLIFKLDRQQRREVIAGKFALRDAIIVVKGIDNVLTERPAALYDIKGEHFALSVYAINQQSPSIPQLIGSNVLTFSRALEKMAIRNERWLMNYLNKDKEEEHGVTELALYNMDTEQVKPAHLRSRL